MSEVKRGGPGRPAGLPNKASLAIREEMERLLGMPGPIALLKASQRILLRGEEEGDPAFVSAGLSGIGKSLEYAYPKLKSIELSGKVELIPEPIEPGPPPVDGVGAA